MIGSEWRALRLPSQDASGWMLHGRQQCFVPLVASSRTDDPENPTGRSTRTCSRSPMARGIAPPSTAAWQWQLHADAAGDINTAYDVEVYDIDLFDTPTR